MSNIGNVGFAPVGGLPTTNPGGDPAASFVAGAQGWEGREQDYLRGQRGCEAAMLLAVFQLLGQIMAMLQGAKPGERPGAKPGGAKPGDTVKPGSERLENVAGRPAIKMDGPNGFLFKPVSDSDGRSVVLLPKEMMGAKVVIKDPNGQVIDKVGRTGTFGDGRPIFRFGKPGASYPRDSVVEVQLPGGGVKRFQLADPSQRHD